MTTVLVTGIFDLIHVEHVRFLAAAKNQRPATRDPRPAKSRLIVGIESDARVKRLKGANRPLVGQQERKEMLEALSVVDQVIILPEAFDTQADYRKLLDDLKPDIYAVSENSPYLENKQRLCREAGVELRVVHRYNPEYSTSKLVERICKQKRSE